MTVTPRQLTVMLAAFIADRAPLLITGAPGIGKSDLIAQAAQAAGADLIISHPAVADPTDFKGLPWFQSGDSFASFKPFGEFHTALTATRPLVWLLDDLGQAPPSVQAACMQLLLARRVNGHILPDYVTFVAATNRRIDRAGVSGILEPVKSRFPSIVELEANIDDWSQWAIGHAVSPMLIAFLRFKPDMLCAFQATADLTNSPVPRTWANLARVERMTLPAEIEAQAMAGSVGEGAANEYLAFRSMYKSMVNLDAILLNPDKAAIPTKPDQLYATAVGLAARANDTNFSRIATYATRLVVDAQRGVFAALMIRDCLRRDEKLQYTDTFVRLNSGPYGDIISGR